MSTNPFEENSVSPASPPTRAGEMPALAPPPSWPTVIGIIAVVFGVGGVLIGLWGTVFPLVLKHVPVFAAVQDQLDTQYSGGWLVWTVAASLLSIALAVMLLASGIGLVKLRAWSAMWIRTWAVLKMLYALGGAAINFAMQQPMAQQMPTGAPVSAAAMNAMMVVGVLFSLAWTCALPVFVLIWLSRDKVKADIAQWN